MLRELKVRKREYTPKSGAQESARSTNTLWNDPYFSLVVVRMLLPDLG